MAEYFFPDLIEALDGNDSDSEDDQVPDGQGGFVDRAVIETRRIWDRTNPLLHYREYTFQQHFR